jgi:hypothetical protein
MPAFDHDHAPGNASQIGRCQSERQRRIAFTGLRVKNEEIDLVVLALAGCDELALLAHKESMQLKVFPNNRFADSGHAEFCSLDFGF